MISLLVRIVVSIARSCDERIIPLLLTDFILPFQILLGKRVFDAIPIQLIDFPRIQACDEMLI